MRVLAVVLFLAGCPAPEEKCQLHASTPLTESAATRLVADGGILLSENPDCSCVRDGTVIPGPADAAAMGYCALPCEPGCPAGTQCTGVAATRLCLRVASP